MSVSVNFQPPVIVELVTNPELTQADFDVILSRFGDSTMPCHQDSDPDDEGYRSSSPSVNWASGSDIRPSDDCLQAFSSTTSSCDPEYAEPLFHFKQMENAVPGCEFLSDGFSDPEIDSLFPSLDISKELFNMETINDRNLQEIEMTTTEASTTPVHVVATHPEPQVPSFEHILSTDNDHSLDIVDDMTDVGPEDDSGDPDYIPPGDKVRRHKKKPKMDRQRDKAYKNVYKVKSANKRTRRHTAQLWVFLLNCLNAKQTNPSIIEWQNKREGTFVLKDSRKIAELWGKRMANSYKKPMDYEKFSRAIRYYYRKEIILSVPQRLTYKFGPNARGWKEMVDTA